MDHWYTAGRLGADHTADLRQAAVRSALAARLHGEGRLTARRRFVVTIRGLVDQLRLRDRRIVGGVVRRPVDARHDG